jgi:hypothetical protein
MGTTVVLDSPDFSQIPLTVIFPLIFNNSLTAFIHLIIFIKYLSVLKPYNLN